MKANDCINLISQIIAPDSFEQDVDEGQSSGKSLYYSSDMGVVTRVTNHRAYHRTFQDRATKFGMPSRIFSIVFEDKKTTGNNVLRHPRKKQFVIHEYVYPLWQKGHELEEWEVRQIAQEIINSGNGTFNDTTGKALYLPRTSQNPPLNPNLENVSKGRFVHKDKRNQNKKYMKNKNKLNESTLKQIIAESMRKVLGENTEDEMRFLPILKKTYNNLYSEYERWQYAKYKPQGMDEAIDAIINAMLDVKDIIERIEPLPEESHLEDY